MRRVPFRSFPPFVIIFAAFSVFLFCDEPSCIKNYRARQVEKRFGRVSDQKALEEWSKELAEYKKLAEKRIEAGIKTGKLYRKIGETYANLGSFELCVNHLEEAQKFGETDSEIFYLAGICQANLAKVHNWDYNKTKKAEEYFLKVLNEDKDNPKVRYELALLYFAGFTRNNPYRVMDDYFTPDQAAYREKAKKLLIEHKARNADDHRSYFLLASIYKQESKITQARQQLAEYIARLQQGNKKNFATDENYLKALEQLNLLQGN